MKGVLETIVIALGILLMDEWNEATDSVDEYLCCVRGRGYLCVWFHDGFRRGMDYGRKHGG